MTSSLISTIPSQILPLIDNYLKATGYRMVGKSLRQPNVMVKI
jgi:hypothetical protein